MEVMLKLLILLFFLVVAAVVLIEWKLTITQSIGELHLLKVLLPFKAEIWWVMLQAGVACIYSHF